MAKHKTQGNRAENNSHDETAAMIDRDRLAQRAYELYLERGGEDGQDIEDWLVAERELRGRGPSSGGR
jgi:hypothetical protein